MQSTTNQSVLTEATLYDEDEPDQNEENAQQIKHFYQILAQNIEIYDPLQRPIPSEDDN